MRIGHAWGLALIPDDLNDAPVLRRLYHELERFSQMSDVGTRELITYWHSCRSFELALAVARHEGVRVLLNVRELQSLSSFLPQLNLIADLVICRDTRPWVSNLLAMWPMPPDYSRLAPITEFEGVRLPPVVIRSPLGRMGVTILGGEGPVDCGCGREGILVAGPLGMFPADAYEWIQGVGGHWLRSGEVVYASFYPDLDLEAAFVDQGFFPPTAFRAVPIQHEDDPGYECSSVSDVIHIDIPYADPLDLRPDSHLTPSGHVLMIRKYMAQILEVAQGSLPNAMSSTLSLVSKMKDAAHDMLRSRKDRIVEKQLHIEIQRMSEIPRPIGATIDEDIAAKIQAFLDRHRELSNVPKPPEAYTVIKVCASGAV